MTTKSSGTPKVSVALFSHQKPAFIKQAVYSLLGQSFQDWQGILVDSGKLFREGFFSEFNDPRLAIEDSGEPPGIGKTRNQASHLFNRLVCDGRLPGELILTLCDDDLFYPWAMHAFWSGYEARGKKPLSLYASIHLGVTDANGLTKLYSERVAAADRAFGFDRQVDYLQFCMTAAGVAAYRKKHGDEIFSERLEDRDHADGVFMERMAAIEPVVAVPYFVGVNRRTPQSGFCGAEPNSSDPAAHAEIYLSNLLSGPGGSGAVLEGIGKLRANGQNFRKPLFKVLYALRKQRRRATGERAKELLEAERTLTSALGSHWYALYWLQRKTTKPFLDLARNRKKLQHRNPRGQEGGG